MARVKLNDDSIKQAVATADQLLETMQYFAKKFKDVNASSGGGFPAGYGVAIAQLGEGLNAVNAIIKAYNSTTIDAPPS